MYHPQQNMGSTNYPYFQGFGGYTENQEFQNSPNIMYGCGAEEEMGMEEEDLYGRRAAKYEDCIKDEEEFYRFAKAKEDIHKSISRTLIGSFLPIIILRDPQNPDQESGCTLIGILADVISECAENILRCQGHNAMHHLVSAAEEIVQKHNQILRPAIRSLCMARGTDVLEESNEAHHSICLLLRRFSIFVIDSIIQWIEKNDQFLNGELERMDWTPFEMEHVENFEDIYPSTQPEDEFMVKMAKTFASKEYKIFNEIISRGFSIDWNRKSISADDSAKIRSMEPAIQLVRAFRHKVIMDEEEEEVFNNHGIDQRWLYQFLIAYFGRDIDGTTMTIHEEELYADNDINNNKLQFESI